MAPFIISDNSFNFNESRQTNEILKRQNNYSPAEESKGLTLDLKYQNSTQNVTINLIISRSHGYVVIASMLRFLKGVTPSVILLTFVMKSIIITQSG